MKKMLFLALCIVFLATSCSPKVYAPVKSYSLKGVVVTNEAGHEYRIYTKKPVKPVTVLPDGVSDARTVTRYDYRIEISPLFPQKKAIKAFVKQQQSK